MSKSPSSRRASGQTLEMTAVGRPELDGEQKRLALYAHRLVRLGATSKNRLVGKGAQMVQKLVDAAFEVQDGARPPVFFRRSTVSRAMAASKPKREGLHEIRAVHAAHVDQTGLAVENLAHRTVDLSAHAQRSGVVVARPDGNHAQHGSIAFTAAHDAVCDFVDDAVAAQNEDRLEGGVERSRHVDRVPPPIRSASASHAPDPAPPREGRAHGRRPRGLFRFLAAGFATKRFFPEKRTTSSLSSPMFRSESKPKTHRPGA